jgi:glyoxylase-like metal-dependent hydrolase (beta-lactamase superfamily II)
MPDKFRLQCAAAVAVCLVAALWVTGPGASGQQPVGTVPLTFPPEPIVVDGIEVLPVQGQVYLVTGGGANVVAQIGDEGILVVDSGASGQADKILAALRRVTRKPIRFLINTNPDPDHIAGNGVLVQGEGGLRGPRPAGVGGANPQGQNLGIVTIAHENAVNHMVKGSAGLPPLTGDALPASTFFTPRKDFFSNGEPVQLLFQPAAHTDGDILVFFRKSDVVATGDVFVTTNYPVFDPARGGSVQGIIDGLNNILDLTVPERNQMGGTRVIPGHGRICNEADVLEYRDMVTIIRDRVQAMVKKGMSLAQVQAARVSLEYDGIYGSTSGGWTTEMFIEAIYKDLNKK